MNELLKHPIAYKLPWSRFKERNKWQSMEIEAVNFAADGQRPTSWCIRELGSVLARDGEWEIEPRPSMREPDFIQRTRFSTAQEAAEFAASVYAPLSARDALGEGERT